MNPLKNRQEASKKTAECTSNSLKKFEDLDHLFNVVAADTVDYYFYIDKEFENKNEFKKYLKSLITIYVNFMNDHFDNPVYDDMDHPIQRVVTYIEERYDFLLCYGEPYNPSYRRREFLKAEGKNPYSVEFSSIKNTLYELIESDF